MTAKADAGPHLAHMVFFALKDRSPAAVDQLVENCHKYLSGHPGELYFSVGKRVPDLTRPVNDQKFDVALHVIFASRQAHDDYQAAPRHLEFIEKSKPNWDSVQVCDSYLA